MEYEVKMVEIVGGRRWWRSECEARIAEGRAYVVDKTCWWSFRVCSPVFGVFIESGATCLVRGKF